MASTGAGLRTTFGAHHAGRTVPFRSNRCNIRAWIKPAKHERDHEHDWSSPHALAIEEIAAEALQDLPSMMESKDMDSRWDWESGR